MANAFTAWKIAKGLYIVPLLFVWSPLITGTPLEMLTVFAFALFGDGLMDALNPQAKDSVGGAKDAL